MRDISSVEVEGCLLRHPAVQEVAVVGLSSRCARTASRWCVCVFQSSASSVPSRASPAFGPCTIARATATASLPEQRYLAVRAARLQQVARPEAEP